MVVALGCGLLPSSPVRVADSRGRLEQRRMCRQSRSSVPPVAVLSSFKSTSPTSKEALAEEVWSNEKQYVLQTYARPKIVFTRGKGCMLYDVDDKAYLDFTAGIAVNALGHSDEGWQRAVRDQAALLCHTSNLYLTMPGATLARGLVENSFADRVFFCNSGTEANEAAIKFARKYQRVKWEKARKGRLLKWPISKPASEFISFTDCFHGRTMGALALTYKEGYRKPFAPLMPGGGHFAPFGDIAAVRRMVKKGVTAAIFCEPVQGEGGIRPAPPGFLAELRALCDDIGALLVFDEVQCGLGRTGNLWGHQWGDSQVTPDIMTLAKPLAGGLPIGAVLMTQAVADVMQPGDHGSTFAGGPLVCAAAQYTFDTIKQPAFLKRVTDRGQQLVLGLRVALANMPHVKEVRGAGLLVGIQLDTSASPVVDACRERGLLIITAGKGDIIRLVPPLTVSAAEVDQAIGILKEAIAAALPATAPTANALKH